MSKTSKLTNIVNFNTQLHNIEAFCGRINGGINNESYREMRKTAFTNFYAPVN